MCSGLFGPRSHGRSAIYMPRTYAWVQQYCRPATNSLSLVLLHPPLEEWIRRSVTVFMVGV